jgi:hypothetical protein
MRDIANTAQGNGNAGESAPGQDLQPLASRPTTVEKRFCRITNRAFLNSADRVFSRLEYHAHLLHL